ncbi:YheC/YheD family protein [Brevibacillus centrosporus]|uniref:YheC/YheD family endospore coat-associated protein n=1 Tax=Brevibacillus centrosporus TaxID=54910 RepID=UPI003B0223E1
MHTKQKNYIGFLVPTLKRAAILRKYANYQSHSPLFAFSSKSINWKSRRITGLEYVNGRWNRRSFPFPKVIYNCCYGDKRALLKRFEKTIGPQKCFNALSRFSKWAIYQILADSPFQSYLPKSHTYDSNQLITFLEEYRTAFLKPHYGSKGQGILRVECNLTGTYTLAEQTWDPSFVTSDPSALITLLENKMGTKKYLIQKEIRMKKINDRSVDFRVMVQKNGQGNWAITGELVRFANRQSYLSNLFTRSDSLQNVLAGLYQQWPQKAATLIHEIHKVCLGVAERLDQHYGHIAELGIDITIDHIDQIWLIEVNSRPSKMIFKDLDQSSLELLYQTTIDYAEYLIALHNS